MRAWALLAVLGLAAAPAAGLGEIAAHGVGVGTFVGVNGSTCHDSVVAIEILYLDPGRASLHAESAGLCGGGVALLLGQGRYDAARTPPLRLDFVCEGTEAAGLRCEGWNAGRLTAADVGPSEGPGSVVALSIRASFRFTGSFVAV